MALFQPHHLTIQSEDGKSVTMPSNKIDNGKINMCDSIRLTSLTYTNTMTTFTEADKTFTIEIAPWDNTDWIHLAYAHFTVAFDFSTTKRYTTSTLVFHMNSQVEAMAAITHNGNTYLPSDYIQFDIFPDVRLVEMTLKDTYYAKVIKSKKLGFPEDMTFYNPLYIAWRDDATGQTVFPTPSQIQGTEYKSYANYLVQLSPTDVIHVDLSMCNGVDVITNMESNTQQILHSLGVGTYYGNITNYVNENASAVAIMPKEHTSIEMKLLDRGRNEIDFKGVGWVACLELTYMSLN